MTLADEQAYFEAYENGKKAAYEVILNAAVELDKLALHGIISLSRAAEILNMSMDEFRDVINGKPSDFQTLAEWKARYYTLKAEMASMGKARQKDAAVEKQKNIRSELKEIIQKLGHGLPPCPEAIYQCDWWSIGAIEIFSDICDKYNLYEEDEEEVKDEKANS